MLLDLLLGAARSRADRSGRGMDRRADMGRAPKAEVMCLEKTVVIATTVKRLGEFLKGLNGGTVTFSEAAEGVGRHRSTIYRRPEYRSLVVKANGVELDDDLATQAAADPEYARVAHLTKAELIEEIRRAGPALKGAEIELSGSLGGAKEEFSPPQRSK